MPIAPNEPANVDVVFAVSRNAAASRVQRPALVVVPDPNSWNDYGLQLFADLHILATDDTQQVPISIMFEGETDTHAFLTSQLQERGSVIPAAEIGRPFVTLQREPETYGVIVEALGFDAAIEGFRALHDAVLARLEEQDQETVRLTGTNEFHTGMVRNASQYVALRRGGQHLRRSPAPTVPDAATSFTITALLPAADEPCAVSLDFEPDEIFQDRCCVLIGRNGVGKTQLLNGLVGGLRAEGDDTAVAARLTPQPDVRRVVVFSSVRSDPYPRRVPPWEGLDYEYHPLIADDLPLGATFMTALLDCLRDDGGAFGGARRGRSTLLKEGMEKLGFWGGLRVPIKNAVADEFHLVERIGDKPFVPIGQGLNEYRLNLLFPAIEWDRSAVVLSDSGRPRDLSSGELAMANFVAQAVASIENGSLLLFDEPETHLHPAFISDFIDLLQELLDRTGSIAVIGTHSPYIVREVPRQRVTILQLRDRRGAGDGEADADEEDGDDTPEPVVVDVLAPQMQTFGANIDDISRFVFGDGSISHRYQRVLARWAEEKGAGLGIRRVVRRYGETLSSEALSLIARTIRSAGAR